MDKYAQSRAGNGMGESTISVGSVLGGYKIEREIGRGGMGVVYKAHELSLNRKVALKVLSQRFASDEEFIKRFKREAQIVAALNHPNIVNILSYGEERGLYYFAMEYISGKDLGQILQEKTVMPLEEVLSIAAQAASALAEAGARGVVHRDLKPSNIMIDKMGRVKVTDFGVAHFQDADAKLTQTGLFLGTPEYASPEQASGRPIDVRSDIYALGAVMYRMLTGKPPVTDETPLAVVMKIATEPVIPISQINSSLPKPVCELICKMMAKEPNERFQTPEAVLTAINRCIDMLKIDIPLAKSKIEDRRPMPLVIPKRMSYIKILGGIAGVALAVFLIVWLVEGGFLKPTPKPKSLVDTEPVPELRKPVDTEPVPETEKPVGIKPVPEQVVHAPPSLEVKKPKPLLPKSPTALMVVSGDEIMAALVRANLESIVAGSGLRVTPVYEVPMLKEKIQLGRVPLTWYSIKRFIPKDKVHILLLAEVQKTGSMPLEYYGRTQELTTATFSVRAIDMTTGTSVTVPVTGSVSFTSLNMEENFKTAIASAASDMGAEIMRYWKEKK
jgi:serine/threonine protein kinase